MNYLSESTAENRKYIMYGMVAVFYQIIKNIENYHILGLRRLFFLLLDDTSSERNQLA
jgi:hypothetical protein